MSDEIREFPPAETGASPQSGEGPVVAFCQQCGRGLTASGQRRVGASLFCEPCAAARLAQPAGWTPVNAGAPPRYPGSLPQAAGSGSSAEPNPLLAGFLGLIPGVGAMYNGQYAKGVIHLIVFVVLVSLADNVNWVLWWFVWGWIFYQGFEAYHTAVARREGQPPPDPFGWNELGDRLGFSRGWAPASAVVRPNPGTATAPPPAANAYATRPPSSPVSPMQADSDFYAAPLSGFSPGAPVSGAAAAPVNPGTPTAVPYASTFTGSGSPQATGQPMVVPGSRRFPIGAAWLIGLGALFLVGNLLPSWHLDGTWLVPLLLAAIALWLGGSRIVSYLDTRSALGNALPRASVAGTLLGPSLLLTVAILLALQDASLVPMRHSWPVLLIVWGAFLLLQRAADIALSSPKADPLSQESGAAPVSQGPLR